MTWEFNLKHDDEQSERTPEERKRPIGKCRLCGHVLRALKSVALGIGPTCAFKYGIKMIAEKNGPPISSAEFHYAGLHGWHSKCGIEFLHSEDRRFITVVLTELLDNPGTSVTNVIELIATQVRREMLKGYETEQIRWIDRSQYSDTPDFEVEMTFICERYVMPKWKAVVGAVK